MSAGGLIKMMSLPFGPEGANEQDHVLINDYNPKYLRHMRIHWQVLIFPYMHLCFPYVP
jgi:hypothetical protein